MIEKKVITLQEYKIRDHKFVPKNNILELDWKSYCDLCSPSKNILGLMVLRKAAVGAFVGVLKSRNGFTNFIYVPQDTTNKISPLVKKMPDLQSRLHSIYKILSVDFGSRFKE